jgi:hypothetical protein
MGFRDSALSKPGGGGRLNNVDGTIVAYEFSDTFPYESKKGGKPKKDAYPSLFLNLSVKADGAEDATIEPIFAGDSTQWTVSEDGYTLSPSEDADGTPRLFGAINGLLGSMFDAGFPEPDYEEGGDIDLTSLLNQRFRFVQVKDETAKTKQLGKNGKEYDRKILQVTAYHGEATEAKPAKSGVKASSAFAKGGKANGAAKSNAAKDTEELTEYADGVLKDILTAAKGNKIDKSALTGAVTRKLLGNPKREAIRKLMFSDEYLGREEGWTYDQSAKNQPIELAE